LWVNMPAALKMSQPEYREIKAADFPTVDLDGAQVRLVAGEVNAVRGPVTEIAADPLYMDVHLSAGINFHYPIPAGHTAIAYVFEGQGTFGTPGQPVEALQMLVLSDGDSLSAQAAPGSSLRFILMAGAPFHEPVVPYGPFVMNTEDEIRQALADLRNGTFVR